ncbi:MAG: adenine deaminase [Candidatus Heimdallarchaeota archaeon]|nr:adenine deaminase [Candidatus Heimdallarchaeota archaeon]
MNTKKLIDSSMARIKADIILRGGKYVNVYTKELLKSDIVITENKIVHIGLDTTEFEGEKTKIIMLEGEIICPGLIESHIHIESSMLTLPEFSKAVIPHGTTTLVIDPHELANVSGIPGLNILIEESKTLPLRYLIEAPSCVPSLPGFETSGAVLDKDDVEELMARDEIFALAEMMNYPGVFLGFDEVVSKIDSAKKYDKKIEGHAPLLKGKELQTYIAAGISSDHEATSSEEVLEKLRLGMKMQIRQGSFAKDLENIFADLDLDGIDTRNIIMASDDRNPIDLKEQGHLDYTYRLLLKSGINPLEAIQMLTLNTAIHLGLQDVIGGIAPGKNADLVVIDNLEDFEVKSVIADGKIIYNQGELIWKEQSKTYPDFILDSLRNLQVPSVEDLKIATNKEKETIVRVIGVEDHSLITQKLTSTLQVENGVILPNLDEDILPIVIINRHTNDVKIGKGFVKGLGIKEGALASTVAHDCHQLICVGTDYNLMLKAIEVVKNMSGGQVVVTSDKITSLQLSFAGIMSIKPLEVVVEETKALRDAVFELDPKVSEPFMALAFIALPVIPHLKITDFGLVDADNFELVSVELE